MDGIVVGPAVCGIVVVTVDGLIVWEIDDLKISDEVGVKKDVPLKDVPLVIVPKMVALKAVVSKVEEYPIEDDFAMEDVPREYYLKYK